MLNENQSIIYRKDGSEISRITKKDLEEFPLGLAQYIRSYQPFSKKSNILTIPKKGREIRTTEIQNVERKDNLLFVKTLNSVYEIEYKGIDLERVLADNQFEGINKSADGITPAKFPEKY
ncbi:MAG: hypothetical protein PHH54_06870 [Candidatus Nanoarchaeia archaeon]|nr:hypothetical protein [Candidatus Nanoarchaeia archaeon]